MKRRYLTIGDFKRNVLIVTAAACLGLSACEPGNRYQEAGASQNEWSGGSQQFSQGIVTEMTEVSPDNWKITDERPAPAGQVAAVLRYHDGRVDTLQGLELDRRMQDYAAQHPTNVHRSGMMDVMMWSGIGFMAGRMMSPSPQYYANPQTMQRTSAWRNQVQQERVAGSATNRGTYRNNAPASGRTGAFSNRGSGFSS
jgi:hypothetical protein